MPDVPVAMVGSTSKGAIHLLMTVEGVSCTATSKGASHVTQALEYALRTGPMWLLCIALDQLRKVAGTFRASMEAPNVRDGPFKTLLRCRCGCCPLRKVAGTFRASMEAPNVLFQKTLQ